MDTNKLKESTKKGMKETREFIKDNRVILAGAAVGLGIGVAAKVSPLGVLALMCIGSGVAGVAEAEVDEVKESLQVPLC